MSNSVVPAVVDIAMSVSTLFTTACMYVCIPRANTAYIKGKQYSVITAKKKCKKREREGERDGEREGEREGGRERDSLMINDY